MRSEFASVLVVLESWGGLVLGLLALGLIGLHLRGVWFCTRWLIKRAGLVTGSEEFCGLVK